MRNIRLTLAYDGTNYVGWQVQPNGPTVQAELETAIRKLTGETLRVTASGRTDSGVHALGQVANFHTACSIPAEKFCPALEGLLPRDIAVRHADEVPADFHATYSARRKRYRYVILNHRRPYPFLRNYVLRVAQPLDVDAMQAAAEELIGTHDFRSFESQFGTCAGSERTVMEAAWGRAAEWPLWDVRKPRRLPGETAATQPTADGGRSFKPEPEVLAGSRTGGDFLSFDIVADGFLYNMVRSIVGTLLNVGRGRWTPRDVRHILEKRDRADAGETAPAHGLYLVSVDYDDESTRIGLDEERGSDGVWE
ncbi:MAG: tRNA pseudouridine(38-40) synthase TruA [Planctomycetaceae bacterium]